MQKRALAIQDVSCVGKCSLTVALPIISAAGIEASVIPTAILSSRNGGSPDHVFRDLTEDIVPVTEHWKTLGLSIDAIYTGYLGSLRQLELVAGIVEEFRQEETIVLVDPVMAGCGVLYPAFDDAFVLGMRSLCARADVIVPNVTEACLLLGKDYPGEAPGRDFVEATLAELSALGPARVVLTGISFEQGSLGAAAFDAAHDKASYCFAERVQGSYFGKGDIFASALLASLVSGAGTAAATDIACTFTAGAIRRTASQGSDPAYGIDFEQELPELIRMLGYL